MPLIVIAALLGVLVGWPYLLVRHAIPRSQLNRLVIGMTKDDVRNVLGEPREIRRYFWRNVDGELFVDLAKEHQP